MTPTNPSLPEWMRKKEGQPLQNWRCVCGRTASMEHSFGGFCEARVIIERYHEALAIAWEALRELKNIRYESRAKETCDDEDYPALVAMKRIEKLGEGER